MDPAPQEPPPLHWVVFWTDDLLPVLRLTKAAPFASVKAPHSGNWTTKTWLQRCWINLGHILETPSIIHHQCGTPLKNVVHNLLLWRHWLFCSGCPDRRAGGGWWNGIWHEVFTLHECLVFYGSVVCVWVWHEMEDFWVSLGFYCVCFPLPPGMGFYVRVLGSMRVSGLLWSW